MHYFAITSETLLRLKCVLYSIKNRSQNTNDYFVYTFTALLQQAIFLANAFINRTSLHNGSAVSIQMQYKEFVHCIMYKLSYTYLHYSTPVLSILFHTSDH